MLPSFCLGPLALCDIARNRRCADDPTAGILDGRDTQRNVDGSTILVHPDRLEKPDALTASQPFQDRRQLVRAVGRDDEV
jgi:hypothetical protein